MPSYLVVLPASETDVLESPANAPVSPRVTPPPYDPSEEPISSDAVDAPLDSPSRQYATGESAIIVDL